ncbi:MAG: SH3 domain-containing protein [Pseudomonadota bacterium]
MFRVLFQLVGGLLAASLWTGAGTSAAIAGACVINVEHHDVLNVRSAPHARALIVAELAPDTCGVHVGRDCHGHWCRVAVDGLRGWAHTGYLDANHGAVRKTRLPSHAWPPHERPRERLAGDFGDDDEPIYCVALSKYDALNVRAGPSTAYDVIGALPGGSCYVPVTGSCIGWWCRTTRDSFDGWVFTRRLRQVN